MMGNFAQIIVDVPAQVLQFFLLNVKMMIISFSILEWFLSTKLKRQFA